MRDQSQKSARIALWFLDKISSVATRCISFLLLQIGRNMYPKLFFASRKSVKACLLLFPILGTTWVFCVLLIVKYSLAVEYIFNILNSLQVNCTTKFPFLLIQLLKVHEILKPLFGRHNHKYFTILGILHFPVLCHAKHWGTCLFSTVIILRCTCPKQKLCLF